MSSATQSATEIKCRPILFSTPMIRSILAETKTQTRRIVKTPAKDKEFYLNGAGKWSNSKTGEYHEIAYGVTLSKAYEASFLVAGDMGFSGHIKCPYGKPGDRLWVREAWGEVLILSLTSSEERTEVIYRAENETYDKFGMIGGGWKPSIHMPRWASRITLEIVNVRVERLQNISEEDAIAEGVPPFDWDDGKNLRPIEAFTRLWDSINAKTHPWDSSPFVWVVEFKRVDQEAT